MKTQPIQLHDEEELKAKILSPYLRSQIGVYRTIKEEFEYIIKRF
jgi:hypothetical protein